VIARGAWVAVSDGQGRFDVAQALLVVGLGLVSYGAALLHPAAGFLVPGALLIWWTLPSRPPFVSGPRRDS
jgi:hypothetical protein